MTSQGSAATLPERYRYSVVSALRQTCEAGVRYGYMTRNPAKLAGKNPQPSPRGVRVYTAEELRGSGRSSRPRDAAAVEFAAATGLRPAEWASVERQDVDRARRVLRVRGTKTLRSRREVPLTSAALAALDAACRGSTRRTCSRAAGAGRSMSITSGGGSGGQRSRRRGSRSRPGCTTSAARSRRTRSRRDHDVRAGPDHGHVRRR